MDNFVALAKVNENIYLDLAKNGARVLFDLGVYRVLDGVSEDNTNCFMIKYSVGEPKYYLIDLKTCYELVTAFYCGGDKSYLLSLLFNIEHSVNE